MADHCYVSQWHLSKLLNKHLNQSFYDLLNAVRVRQAKQLMDDPALRISEVAERVGYADTAHFSRVFKNWRGSPPENGGICTAENEKRMLKPEVFGTVKSEQASFRLLRLFIKIRSNHFCTRNRRKKTRIFPIRGLLSFGDYTKI